MRKTIWKIQGKNQEEKDLAREEGLKYIEIVKAEDELITVIEDNDKFTILLKDANETIL